MRVANNVFIVIFLAIMVLPLVFVDLSQNRVSVQENRMLANHPKLADIKNRPETFIRDFDAWFKDSTGFREHALTLFNAIERNTWLNGIWYADGSNVYLIGEEGHHYFAGTSGSSLIPKFQGYPFLSDNQLAIMVTKLEEVKKYLDRKNIPLVVTLCTDKESIYPEFYPKSIKRGPEPIQLDVITNYLQEHTSVDVFNIRQALLAEKNNYLLYAKSGGVGVMTHYNELGAFFAYRELMRHINAYFPEIIPFELKDIDISYGKEGNHTVSLKTETTYKTLENSFFDDVRFADHDILGRGSFCVAYESTKPDQPVILLMRDSFFSEEYTGKYIAQQFGRTIMIHFFNMEYLEEYVARYEPDIVVIETTERQLGMLAESFARIPDLQ